MTLPITGQIIEATAQQPYLCLRIDIDPGVVADLLAQLPAAVLPPEPASRALYLARTSAPLLDPVLRLARLLDTPREAPVLPPLALREIQYRVLTGDLSGWLRHPCEADGPVQRVRRAIHLVTARLADALLLQDTALSPHTSPTPLQP